VSRRWSSRGYSTAQEIQKCPGQKSRTQSPFPALWVLGGALKGQASTLKYDLVSKWMAGPALLQERDGPAVTSHQNVIYVVGGKNHSGPMASVERMEPNQEWQLAPSLQTARRRHAAVQIGNCIMALGGLASKRGDRGPIAPNEALQLDIYRAWEKIACCRIPRWGLAAVASNDYVYALGGIDEAGDSCASMEVYSLSTDSWADAPAMNEARYNVGAAITGDFIYAVGGRQGRDFLDSVERFSLKTSAWENVASLQTPRCCCEVVAVGGHIFALGGYGSCGRLSSVERFDPTQEVWIIVDELPGARNCMASAVIFQ